MRFHDRQVAAVGMTVGFGLMVALGSGCMLPSLDDSGAAGADAYEAQDQQNSGPDDGSGPKADSNEPAPDATGGGDAGVNDTGSPGSEDTGSGGGGGGGDTGEGDDPDTGNGGSGDPEFSEVQTLLDDNCAECHSGSGTGASSSSLEFPSESPSPSEYETALSDFITEGDGENSALYIKLTPDASGQEMPIGSWNVDEQEAEQTIKDWIDAGAPYE